MSSGCRSSSCCVDAREPVRVSYKVLYKWPESDVEFVKSVTAAERRGSDDGRAAASEAAGGDPAGERRKRASVPVVDGFSCRQMYLRSYVFTTKKETVPEKTRRRFKRALSRAWSDGSSENMSVAGSSEAERKKTKKSRKMENCGNTRKLRAVLRSAIHRLLCTGAVGGGD